MRVTSDGHRTPGDWRSTGSDSVARTQRSRPLAPEDTKTDEPRLIVLTSRAREALRTLHSRFKKTGFVFVNPKRKSRWVDIKKRFRRAVDAAELHGLWFHGGASSPGRAESASRNPSSCG